MANQNNPLEYGEAIQYQLTQIVNPVPVYAAFNRNFASQPKFITWNLRNVHQDVYTGQTQSNKGIDRPIFQANIFAQSMQDAFNISNTILQSLHGYSGQFGGVSGFFIAKCDVNWLYNTYDNELGLNQIVLDCTLDIPT
jgi:hypothetical protein